MERTETITKLGALAPEPWGSKLCRARDGAGLSLDQACRLLGGEMSRATLNRLEKLTAPPADQKGRRRAALACLLYGVRLGDLDLSVDDVPRWVDVETVVDLRKHAPGWLRHQLQHAA